MGSSSGTFTQREIDGYSYSHALQETGGGGEASIYPPLLKVNHVELTALGGA